MSVCCCRHGETKVYNTDNCDAPVFDPFDARVRDMMTQFVFPLLRRQFHPLLAIFVATRSHEHNRISYSLRTSSRFVRKVARR